MRALGRSAIKGMYLTNERMIQNTRARREAENSGVVHIEKDTCEAGSAAKLEDKNKDTPWSLLWLRLGLSMEMASVRFRFWMVDTVLYYWEQYWRSYLGDKKDGDKKTDKKIG